MGRTVREIEQLPATEILEWWEFYRLEPFGVQRDNFHAAMIAHRVANAFRSSSREVPFEQFFYRSPDERRKQDDQRAIEWLNSKVKHA